MNMPDVSRASVFSELCRPSRTTELAVLEHRVDDYVGLFDLAGKEFINSLHLLVLTDLLLKLAEILVKRSSVCGNDLIYTEDLVDGLTDNLVLDLILTSVIVRGFHRLGDLSLLQILDGQIVFRL